MKIVNNDLTKRVNHSFVNAAAKNESHDTVSVDSWLSKAADAYISQNGKKLSDAARLLADKDTGAEISLQEINTQKKQINSDKQRISEIDKTLSEDDGRLTYEDKKTLKKERETLQKRSETPEDIMHKEYQQVRTLEKQRDFGKLTDEDILSIDNQIDHLHLDINRQKNILYQQGKNEESLSQKAVHERVAQDEKTTEKLDQQVENKAQEQANQSRILQQEAVTKEGKKEIRVVRLTQSDESEKQGKK